MANNTSRQPTDTSTTDTAGTPKHNRGEGDSTSKISPPIQPTAVVNDSTTGKISPPSQPE